jgi:oligosaccharide repeat unit polymerase
MQEGNSMVRALTRYLLLAMTVVFMGIGYIIGSNNMILVAIVCLFLHNVLYCTEHWKQCALFFFFNLTFFVFLLSRPFISMVRGDCWWYFSTEQVHFALTALSLSLIMLLVGAVAAVHLQDYLRNKNTRKEEIKGNENASTFSGNLQIISLVFFYGAFVFFMLLEMEKLIYVWKYSYYEYYTSFHSRLPYVFYEISSMMKYCLCIFLATLPKKNKTMLPFILYLVSAMPAMLMGLRNPIVLNALFILVYYLIRDILQDTKKWFGRAERIFLMIALPIGVLFLGAFNYIREGAKINAKGPVGLVVDFFYKQGVSFDVLNIGYGATSGLPQRAFRNYTFGNIIDYFMHGTIAQKLFGASALQSGNNLDMALNSNSYAHNMSYVARGQEYLDGHGWGSSYLLETFTDFGYIGIIIFSLILGFIFVAALRWFQKNQMLRIIILLSLTSIFFVPRAETTGWIMFLLTLQFWAAILICFGGAWLVTKKWGSLFIDFERRRAKMDEQIKKDILKGLWKWKWLMLILTIILSLSIILLAKFRNGDFTPNGTTQKEIYSSSQMWYVEKNSASNKGADTYTDILKTDMVLKDFYEQLLEDYSKNQLYQLLVMDLQYSTLKEEDMDFYKFRKYIKFNNGTDGQTFSFYVESLDEQLSKRMVQAAEDYINNTLGPVLTDCSAKKIGALDTSFDIRKNSVGIVNVYSHKNLPGIELCSFVIISMLLVCFGVSIITGLQSSAKLKKIPEESLEEKSPEGKSLE